MKPSEMLEKAANDIGVRELARRLNWNASALSEVKKGNRPMPPYRAAQLAELVGEDAKLAYLVALQERAESDGERKLLGELLRVSKAASRVLTIVAALYVVTFITPKPARAGISSDSVANIHY